MKSFVFYILVLTLVSTHVCAHIINWNGNFSAIVLPDLTYQDQVETGSSKITLFLDGDAEISADNSTDARLDGPTGDNIFTRYKLSFDGDGVTETGGAGTSMTNYDIFLATPIRITHVPGDDEVEVTLKVRVRPRDSDPENLADAGLYTATQTLTVVWVGP